MKQLPLIEVGPEQRVDLRLVVPESPMRSDATVSDCGKYRYSLLREWTRDGRRACWVMLNPSTADASQDDPTIRKCIAYSKLWGYGSLEVVNLFAFRATDASVMWAASLAGTNIVGPDAGTFISLAVERAALVVCGWGEGKSAFARTQIATRGAHVLETITQHAAAHCLVKTKNGNPGHPLYLRGDLRPVLYQERQR